MGITTPESSENEISKCREECLTHVNAQTFLGGGRRVKVTWLSPNCQKASEMQNQRLFLQLAHEKKIFFLGSNAKYISPPKIVNNSILCIDPLKIFLFSESTTSGVTEVGSILLQEVKLCGWHTTQQWVFFLSHLLITCSALQNSKSKARTLSPHPQKATD